MKRIASGIILILLLITMVTLTSNVQPVKAEVHDVAVINILVPQDAVLHGATLSINVTVANEGDYSETFDLNLYANITIIETKVITLASGTSTTLTFTWDNTGFAVGGYAIKAQAQQVSGETDTDDNVYIDGTVQVLRTGPQMDSLYIKYYGNASALYDALMNGEVDLTNWVLNQTQIDEVFNDTNIQAAISPPSGMFEFDLNNNDTIPTYPNWTSPTAYKKFRQGIACLVNKTHIVNDICNYSYRIDTPIPRPTGDWWVDWSVTQYDSYGDLLGNYPYEYNSTLAASYFDQAGFIEGEYTENFYYDPSFPGSTLFMRIHPETGQDMEPLIFYIRSDDPRRLEAGRDLRDNLRKMGIPVNATETGMETCRNEVMREGDYHIYTGGWIDMLLADSLSIYSSEYITVDLMINYPQFRNATYDEWLKKVLYPSNLTLAREAALKCQKILIEEAVCVWLYTRSLVMGYRNIYGVVNLKGGRIDNQWTFLNARLKGTRTAIYYGLTIPPKSLNIITDGQSYRYPGSSASPEKDCLDRIYDTLLSYCPYDNTPGNVLGEKDRGGTMPWMAEDWEIGEWESPYEPAKNLTKLTFYLRDGIKWHDGIELNSTDIKFTIEYLKSLGKLTSLYSSVSDVHHVTIPDARTVFVYENVSNIWTLDMIGRLPILPKHIFQNIVNVTGYTPGANEGHPANQTLIGSGPWKYVSHNSSMLCLEANREYFMETPPQAEIDFRYDWEMGCWVVDTMDATMLGEAYGTSGNGVPHAKWEPGCDIAKGDCLIDFFDQVVLASEFNATWGRSAKRYVIPPPTDCAIYVEPLGNPILVGENLTVYVKLQNLAKLSGLQFKLNYDNSKLDCLDLNLTRIFNNTYEAKKEINQAKGVIWVSITSSGSTQPVSGNTTLATITFNATKPSGSILDLWNTKLASYGTPRLTCQLMVHNIFDRAVMIAVSTPTGGNITVEPAENVKVTFSTTTTEGITTLNTTQPPSTEFVSVLCHDIETTANYTGNITLQFPYDPTGLSPEDEEAMKIWLWNESSQIWIDITTSVDTEKNIVYGVSPHLSAFGITNCITLEGEMSQEGEITVSTPLNPPPGLAEMKLAEVKYYEIKTTKQYTPPINIRMVYNDTTIPPEQERFTQLWRWNDSKKEWVDITTRVDTTNNVAYGVTTNLSAFGITSLIPPPENISVTDVNFSKTVITQGYNLTISFNVENGGDFDKTFDVIVYRNYTAIATHQIIELHPGTKISLSFTWNTTSWAKANYAISACGRLMNWVVATIPGDVNGDFKCEGKDNAYVAKAYDTRPGQPRWNPNADVNCDNRVEGKDVAIIAKYYNTHYP